MSEKNYTKDESVVRTFMKIWFHFPIYLKDVLIDRVWSKVTSAVRLFIWIELQLSK